VRTHRNGHWGADGSKSFAPRRRAISVEFFGNGDGFFYAKSDAGLEGNLD
jgi:hypothetical protein